MDGWGGTVDPLVVGSSPTRGAHLFIYTGWRFVERQAPNMCSHIANV